MEIDLNKLGSRLKSERKRLGYTQADFAKKTSVSSGSQFGYESGARAPDATYLIHARNLGLDINYVLFGSKGKSKEFDSSWWEVHDEILHTIEKWLEMNEISLQFDKKMELLRLFLSQINNLEEVDSSFINHTLSLVS
jgi:transcriptional regulator with XRE-family HTH domain